MIVKEIEFMNTKNFFLWILFSVLTLAMAGYVAAQEDHQAKAAAPTTPPVHTMASIAANKAISDAQKKEYLIKKLNLKRYDESDAQICAADKRCAFVSGLRCAISACSSEGSKKPNVCFNRLEGDINLLNDLVCKVAVNPQVENIKAFLKVFPEKDEIDFVGGIALVQAIKGNAAVCQDMIKQTLGPYGKNWERNSFIDMSGCRILAKERTRQEEEEDYATWIDVDSGIKTCSEIINVEMFNACSAPGSVSPFSSKAKK